MTIHVEYALKNHQSGHFLRDKKLVVFFKDKMEAKAKRKELNGCNDDGEELMLNGWRVSPQEIE